MPTLSLSLPAARNRFSTDEDGSVFVMKEHDEIFVLELDYSDILDPDETLTASVWTVSGITNSDELLATPKTSCEVTGSDGEIKNTVTTSAGAKIIRRVRFYSPSDADEVP